MTGRYRWIGDHAQEFTVGETSQTVGPEDYIELDDAALKDPLNAEFVENGMLIEAPEDKKTAASSAAKGGKE